MSPEKHKSAENKHTTNFHYRISQSEETDRANQQARVCLRHDPDAPVEVVVDVGDVDDGVSSAILVRRRLPCPLSRYRYPAESSPVICIGEVARSDSQCETCQRRGTSAAPALCRTPGPPGAPTLCRTLRPLSPEINEVLLV